ncbi:MAG: hypothetical protein QM758_25615 [Armatimonas sp.]
MRRDDSLEKDLPRALATPQSQVPAAALAAARGLFSERQSERPGLLARLLFDGRQGLSLARDSGVTSSFQRLFETDTHLIDLWEERNGQSSYLIGQVYDKAIGSALTPDTAILLASDGTTLCASAEGTEWHVGSVPAGLWSVQLYLGEDAVVLEAVEVGA